MTDDIKINRQVEQYLFGNWLTQVRRLIKPHGMPSTSSKEPKNLVAEYNLKPMVSELGKFMRQFAAQGGKPKNPIVTLRSF